MLKKFKSNFILIIQNKSDKRGDWVITDQIFPPAYSECYHLNQLLLWVAWSIPAILHNDKISAIQKQWFFPKYDIKLIKSICSADTVWQFQP